VAGVTRNGVARNELDCSFPSKCKIPNSNNKVSIEIFSNHDSYDDYNEYHCIYACKEYYKEDEGDFIVTAVEYRSKKNGVDVKECNCIEGPEPTLKENTDFKCFFMVTYPLCDLYEDFM